MNTIPLLDPAGQVWDAFICPTELAGLKDKIRQSQCPMLAMDAAIPLNLSDRFMDVLNILTGSICVIFQLEATQQRYWLLSRLAKCEVVMRWEMGNHHEVVKFLLEGSYMELDELETIGPLLS